MKQPILSIIIGSTRPGRIGKPIAEWIRNVAVEHNSFEVELTDLAEIDLPLLNEPTHPRSGDYVHATTRKWSEIVGRADAIVFVTPEYNLSFNAALKNAIDYLFTEWTYKPAAIVSYGGVSAGTRAANALRTTLSAFSMIVVQTGVNIPFAASFLDGDGAIAPNDVMESAAKSMFDELARVTAAASALRHAA
jgi:NAD(P)H-dependent FMN reductase